MSKTDDMAPMVPDAESAAPPRIDERYRIEREIGRGGMGRVFVAHDRNLGRNVAIKVLASGVHGDDALRRFELSAAFLRQALRGFNSEQASNPRSRTDMRHSRRSLRRQV